MEPCSVFSGMHMLNLAWPLLRQAQHLVYIWVKAATCGTPRSGSSLLHGATSPVCLLSFLNRYKALGVADEECEETEEDASVQVLLPKSDQPRTHSTCTVKTCVVKKSWRVVFIDDSLLKGMEAPICRPDSLHKEVCCLPRA